MTDYISKFKKLDLKTKKMISWNLAWNFKSVFKWRWLEFDEFREYESSEDSRHIDWLVSAREQRLLTKKFVVDKSIKVFFIIDTTNTMEFWFEKKKIDILIESFFLLALSSVENWDSVWAIVFNEQNYRFFDAKKWKAIVFEIYKEIVEIEKKYNNRWTININYIFSILNKVRLKNSLLFIITDKMDVKNDKNLKILSLKNDLIYVNIFDNFENTLETSYENSGVLWFMSNFKKKFFIDNLNNVKKEEYKLLRKNKIRDLSLYLNNYWANYIMLDNKSNIYKDFFSFFTKK